MNMMDFLLAPLAPFLSDPAVEEVCINRPGEAWVWSNARFVHHEVSLDASDLMDIAILAGARSLQDVGASLPLLSTDLPNNGGRLQVVLPPCAEQISLTIRKGSDFMPTLDSLEAGGLFAGTKGRRETADDGALVELYKSGRWTAFLRAAVLSKKTVILCGETASGKTTLAKALIDEIPLSERLITIEDTPEWTALKHPNRVALYYSKGGQNAAKVGAGELVEAALRMRIGRLLVQEIRDGQAALAFLSALSSGHPGGITTIHAAHAKAAFDRMRIELRKTPSGAAQNASDVQDMLKSEIHVIAHCVRSGQQFGISEVWFNAMDHIEVAAPEKH